MGVGSTTLQRAVLARSVLRQSSSAGGRELLAQFNSKIRQLDSTSALGKLYYSKLANFDQPSSYTFKESESPSILFSRSNIAGDSGRHTPEQRAAIEHTGGVITKKSIQETVKGLQQNAWKKLATGIADQFRPVRDLDDKAYTLMRLRAQDPRSASQGR